MKHEEQHIETFTDDKIIIKKIVADAYTIPTDSPESDGTIKWDSSTIVLVEISAGNKKGIGYTYSNVAAATIIDTTITKVVVGENCLDIPSLSKKLSVPTLQPTATALLAACWEIIHVVCIL